MTLAGVYISLPFTSRLINQLEWLTTEELTDLSNDLIIQS